MVRIIGTVSDHSRVAIAGRGARLWFRPKRGNTAEGYLLSGGEVQATLNDATGAFTVDLDNASTYVPVLDWLIKPGEDTPEMRARGFEEWPFEVFPDTGGYISDLIDLALGNDRVYSSPTAPDEGVRAGFQLNTVTGDLYQRKVAF